MMKFHTDFLFQFTVERSSLVLVLPSKEKGLKPAHSIISVAVTNIHFMGDKAKDWTLSLKVSWFLRIRNYVYFDNVDRVAIKKTPR